MNFLLTKEELDELESYKILVNYHEILTKEKLQEFCTFVADNTPVKFWGNDEAKIWGCILSEDNHMGYCDECPAKRICPNDRRNWSK